MTKQKTTKSKFQFEGTITVPQCYGCAHLKEGTRACKAYPKGIPVGILTNVDDHTKAQPGDGGVRFQKKEAAK